MALLERYVACSAQIATIMAGCTSPVALQAYADMSCTWAFNHFGRACYREQLCWNGLANVLGQACAVLGCCLHWFGMPDKSHWRQNVVQNNAQQPDERVSLLLLQMATRTEYDKVIQETEGAYHKILESSQTLLTVLKRESVSIQKKRQTSSWRHVFVCCYICSYKVQPLCTHKLKVVQSYLVSRAQNGKGCSVPYVMKWDNQIKASCTTECAYCPMNTCWYSVILYRI